MRKRTCALALAAVVCSSCTRQGSNRNADTDAVAGEPPPASTLDRSLAELRPTPLVPTDQSRKLDRAIAEHFGTSPTRRAYILTDKPLYQPGESIWLRIDLRATGTLKGVSAGVTVSLVSPRGASVAERRVIASNGVAAADFELAADAVGGEYSIELRADDGTHDTRKIVVNTSEALRLKKSVELLRKAYGEGDKVSAAIEMRRATGEPFGEKALTRIITVDDVEVQRVPITTDKEGKALARFDLPAHIARGDGLFTLIADDGGNVESVQKRIPIVLKTIALGLFPEGGDLVAGLPGRVYFAAKSPLGKAADIEGRIVDDKGNVVADLRSIHEGMGRFDLVPALDRTYKVEITKPAGITSTFELPAAKEHGVASCEASTTMVHASPRFATRHARSSSPPPCAKRTCSRAQST